MLVSISTIQSKYFGILQQFSTGLTNWLQVKQIE